MEKKSYDREPIDSSLVKSRDEIKQLILDQIKEANSILNMEVQGHEVVDYNPFGGRGAYWSYNKEQKEAFYNAYNAWNAYNEEILTRAFEHSNNKCRKDYDAIGSVGFYSGHENLVERCRKTIRDKVAYLQGLIKRLPLIPCIEDDKVANDKKTALLQKNPKIFISHKTEDANFAKAIISMLIELGVKHTDILGHQHNSVDKNVK